MEYEKGGVAWGSLRYHTQKQGKSAEAAVAYLLNKRSLCANRT